MGLGLGLGSGSGSGLGLELELELGLGLGLDEAGVDQPRHGAVPNPNPSMALTRHARTGLCRMDFRRKPGRVTACRHARKGLCQCIRCSGTLAPARSQPRWVAAGEPHSNTGFGGGIRDALGFGSYGPHGPTLILYPPSYPYTLYPSQTNCECAKHECNTYNKRSYLCVRRLTPLEAENYKQDRFVYCTG